ncbi:MAG: bifunctional glycosyltransferase family 2/GtrA family protein [Deltaproteobacteria bacterium]|nr:bifunctional glycosyltransferase family 2/GtrA family protein [Deltaproteobacteria bacterium]
MKLSVVFPCYNERNTLRACVERVLGIADDSLVLEILIVDDASGDGTAAIAKELEQRHPEIRVYRHERNQGKGAALRTGFREATGDFVAVQDADLEYDPQDLKRLLAPLIEGKADVVFGSRFLSPGAHRVLYFWHSLGNRFLTFVSNMFTDLNLTDMETCYKVFRREVIQGIDIRENRFGFEPEIVAKVAALRLRIYEMGISYYGRTYEEGKKIGAKDGLRALYCILRYNAHRAPLPVQFLFYLFIGGVAAVFNLLVFLGLLSTGASTNVAAPVAFVLAALLNYVLCILLLFRHKARWNAPMEMVLYWLVVGVVCLIDLGATRLFILWGIGVGSSKALASVIGLMFNFLGRRFFVFPEPPAGPWRPQQGGERKSHAEIAENAEENQTGLTGFTGFRK